MPGMVVCFNLNLSSFNSTTLNQDEFTCAKSSEVLGSPAKGTQVRESDQQYSLPSIGPSTRYLLQIS